MNLKEILKRIKEQNFSYLNPKLEFKESFIEGKGVFAKRLIKKGELLNVFGGIIADQKGYKKLWQKLGGFVKNYTTKVEDNFYLLSCFEKDDLETDDFFNHSCSPNAGFKGQIVMVAIKDIKPGEEAAYDYAMTDSDPEDFFKCNCGAKNCRKKNYGQ